MLGIVSADLNSFSLFNKIIFIKTRFYIVKFVEWLRRLPKQRYHQQ